MNIALNTVDAVVTDLPLSFAPRLALDMPQVIVGGFTDRAEFEQQTRTTFGGLQWLWSEEDDLRFGKQSRELVGIRLHVPNETVPAEAEVHTSIGLLTRRGGLRAGGVRDFGMPRATVLHCGTEAAELVCLPDPTVLDTPLEARIGIAPAWHCSSRAALPWGGA
ncbi:hypothetical protein V1L54_17220 [Streptomyces sp. TRM 70361]|uniref:hypothetical protein n=1 Tax=Streptomyces sp. TRM 70361 TaxID=3116553 RepID=UPI002E7C3E42|nr:hypothetical protein [Streptomyces sp. TRM 70361]MEE1941122.1 hypothetical protein [Streptomyces sp. TRM 70361]